MTELLSHGDTSRAVLVGCHRFADLHDLPAVKNNLGGLAKVLTDPTIWGIPSRRVEVLDQPSSGDDVVDAVARAADAAQDTLVVYYSGHGLVDPSTGELYVALPDSRLRDVLVQRALRYDYLRRIISASGARKKIVLLDCCFSGRGLGVMASAKDLAADVSLVEGTCVITSTSKNALSLAVPGEKYTAFTGVLIDILRQGVPGAGPFLAMETVFDAARRRLASRSHPLPQQSIRNTAGRICIARNRAPAGEQPEPPPQSPPPGEVTNGPETAQVRIYSATGDVLGSGLLLSDDIVGTCAHTLGTAFDVQVTGEVSSGPVALDFPLLRGVPTAQARVVSMPQDGSDVALLRLVTPVVGSRQAPSAEDHRTGGAKFRVFGFPGQRGDGLWASGELRTAMNGGLVQAETTPQSPRMDPGFSGAPVWDETNGGVVGIVMAVQTDGPLAFVLPTPRLSDELDRFLREARQAERAVWAEQARAVRRERSRTRATRLLTQAATICSRITDPEKQLYQLTDIIAAAVRIDVDAARGLCEVLEQRSTLLHDRLAQVRALVRGAGCFALTDSRRAALLAERAEVLARDHQVLRMRKRRRLALYAAASGFARIDPVRAESIIVELGSPGDDDISALGVTLSSMASVDPDRAERMARGLPRRHHAPAERVLSKVAVAVARQQPDRAQELVDGMSDPRIQRDTLVGMAESLADSEPDRAERIALGLAAQGFQSRYLSTLVEVLAPKDPHRAERIARAIPVATARARALESVLKGMSRHDTHRAEHLARTLPEEQGERDYALHILVRRLASTDPGRAEAIARGFRDDEDIANALLCIVDGLRESAPESAARIALSMPGSEPLQRATALARTAQELVWHAPDRAHQLIREAEQSTGDIAGSEDRHLAHSACAAALIESDPERARQFTRQIHDRGQRALARCGMVTALAGTAPALQGKLLARALDTAPKLSSEEHEDVLEQAAAHLAHTPLSRRKIEAFAEQIAEQAMSLPPSESRGYHLCHLADLLVEADRDSAAELAVEALRIARTRQGGDRYNIYSQDALMILAQTDSWRFAELAEPSRPEDSPASADEMGGIWRSLIKAMLERAGSLAADADADDLADQPTSFLCGP
ncbi:caspase, EACC1-associated type [Streptomyces rubiginosohelvolus]|uniref:caspase, EACC1-associated type n=1 Tax=Streptomyces rubiginosohelvolus TaxID=67362 RepID=UPI0036C0A94D